MEGGNNDGTETTTCDYSGTAVVVIYCRAAAARLLVVAWSCRERLKRMRQWTSHSSHASFACSKSMLRKSTYGLFTRKIWFYIASKKHHF